MNAQDFRSLQEAYLEVVENQQLDEISTELAKRAGEERMNRTFALMQKDWKEGKKKPSSEFQKSYKKQQDGEKRYRKKLQQEQVDLYDIILSHLLDEGYAETQEQAEVIMVNMSEGWRESICEEYKKLPVGKMIKQAARHSNPEQVIKMGKVADDHNPKKSKRKEDDNRRIGHRKRTAGMPKSNELQDNW